MLEGIAYVLTEICFAAFQMGGLIGLRFGLSMRSSRTIKVHKGRWADPTALNLSVMDWRNACEPPRRKPKQRGKQAPA